MQKNISLAIVCIFMFSVPVSAAGRYTGDVRLYRELTSSYNSGFYPGVIRYADLLKTEYPSSVYLLRALIYKGECLFRLGRIEPASELLAGAEASAGQDSVLQAFCEYWAGRISFEQKDYNGAARSFYTVCRILQHAVEENEPAWYYNSAIVYAARSCIYQGDYIQAVPLFEYVIAHGAGYGKDDYNDSAECLFLAYTRTAQYDKLLKLYPLLTSLPADIYGNLTLYAGDAEYALGNYRKAFDIYTAGLVSGDAALTAVFFQKAFSVADAHRKEIGTDPGDVLALAQSKLSGYPELLAGFFVRLGIDAYTQGNLIKARSYFSSGGIADFPGLKQIAALYLAEIAFRTGSPAAAGAAAAEKILTDTAQQTTVVQNDSLYGIYRLQLARYAGLQQKWQACASYAAQVKPADMDALYWTSLAEYKMGNYVQTVRSVESGSPQEGEKAVPSSSEIRKLYALALAQTGRISDALFQFGELDAGKSLDDDSRMDYAKTLLLAGKYDAAFLQASKCVSVQAPYISALALFNIGNWNQAVSGFSGYLSSGDSEYADYALFYRGYARYRRSDYPAAYEDLSGFIQKYPQHVLCWEAYMTAAQAAIQMKRFSDAARFAEAAAGSAASQSARQDAVLLCAGIYSDAGEYDKALSFLSVYSSGRDDFSLKSRYETAQILTRKGESEKADGVYGSIVSDFPSDPVTEEAMYRRGELYYSTGSYPTALQRFDAYFKQYPKGRFTDAALYFGADCFSHTGEVQRAILQYSLLLKICPGSTYRYSSMKNLAGLYRSTGDYNAALRVLHDQSAEYGQQAASDGISKQISELEQLAAGTDERIVAKLAEYRNSGTYTSQAGRNAGTELVQLYAASPSTQKNAAMIAEEILPSQQKNIGRESRYAARTAQFLGTYYRQNGRDRESAEKFLLAAEYFRMNKDSDNAAVALYGAVEAFDAAGMYADAKVSAGTLDSLYPESRQNTAAKMIIARY